MGKYGELFGKKQLLAWTGLSGAAGECLASKGSFVPKGQTSKGIFVPAERPFERTGFYPTAEPFCPGIPRGAHAADTQHPGWVQAKRGTGGAGWGLLSPFPILPETLQ